MYLRSLRLFLMLACCGIQSISASAWQCSGAHCDTGKAYCSVDCSHYVEAPVKNGVFPVNVTQQVTLFSVSGFPNCGSSTSTTWTVKDTQTEQDTATVTITGSTTNTLTGGLSGDVLGALEGSVGLSGAVTYSASGTATLQGTHTVENTDSGTTASCSATDVKEFLGWKSGTAAESGCYSYTVPYRPTVLCVGSFTQTLTGTCDPTTSNGSGKNPYNKITFEPSSRDCASNEITPPCTGGHAGCG